jgi:hypothetical protein
MGRSGKIVTSLTDPRRVFKRIFRLGVVTLGMTGTTDSTRIQIALLAAERLADWAMHLNSPWTVTCDRFLPNRYRFTVDALS